MNILITGGNGNIANIIKNNLNGYIIYAPSKNDLNILDFEKLYEYIIKYNINIIIHTAIRGGRRTKPDTTDIVYSNLLMFENIIKVSHKLKLIINLDSAAIYDRKTDIYNNSETDIYTTPEDFYGFSKYIIYHRSLQYDNIYNFRIFNIFHPTEEKDRYIKICMESIINNKEIIIDNDKYFDFFYYLDFIKVIEYYLKNIEKKLEKTINISYNKKYKLSELAKLINPKIKLNITNINSKNNYCGNSFLLDKLNLEFIGLEKSIEHYKSIFLNNI